MWRWQLNSKLNQEVHGSEGFTTIPRLVAVMGLVAALAVGSHLLLESWYAGRMLPGAVAAGESIGGLSLPEARAVLQRQVAAYKLRLTVAGHHYEAAVADIGVTFDPETTLAQAYAAGRGGWWPRPVTDSVPLTYHLDANRLHDFTAALAAEVGTPPVDAGVVFAAGRLATTPDKSGRTVDRLGLTRLIEQDLSLPGSAALQLETREQLADIRTTALAPTLAEAQGLMATPIVLTYNGQTFTPAPADIGQWLAFEKQQDGRSARLVTKVDSTKLKEYVQTVANTLNVAPIAKQVTVKNGVSETTKDGLDGLALDQDNLVQAMAEAVTHQQPLTLELTTHVVPYKTISTTLTTLDAAKYIEVNLSKQHLWVWENQQVIYEAPITSGATGANLGTVTGLFSIYYKTTNTRLRGYQYGYDYDVPVKYWMPFYGGYGLHDAVWRNGKFGGQDYYYGGSHGCVNLPDGAAAFIYNWAAVGTPVWVHK